MKEFIEHITSSFWVFIGCLILLEVAMIFIHLLIRGIIILFFIIQEYFENK